jgi:hypothetical protein
LPSSTHARRGKESIAAFGLDWMSQLIDAVRQAQDACEPDATIETSSLCLQVDARC